MIWLKPTRIYEIALQSSLALMPLAGIWYLLQFQVAEFMIVAHSFHIIATGFAALLSGFIGYVTFLCYQKTGEMLLRNLALSLIGFTICYAPHSILTLLADHDMRLFLIYGPVSRVVMNGFLLLSVINCVRQSSKDNEAKDTRYWGQWIAGFILLDMLTFALVKFSLMPFPFLKIGLETIALGMAAIGLLVIISRAGYRTAAMTLIAMALLYQAQGSIAFLLAVPWSHLWWYAHVVTAIGFFLLSYLVVRAFNATGSLASVYSINELVESLRESESKLRQRNQELIEAESKMAHLAMYDELTGVINRRGFFLEAEKALSRMKRTGSSCMVLMLDIDHFKNINDHYGHGIGDLVLKVFSGTIGKCLRESDLLGRIGGEEFAVILPDTTMADGMKIAERIRSSIEAEKISEQEKDISITVSIGSAAFICQTDSAIHAMLKLADEHLYEAKNSGRNRIV